MFRSPSHPHYDDGGDRDEPEGRGPRYRCGGYGSYYGHCGATDCETCYPGGGSDEEQEPKICRVTRRKVVRAVKVRKDKFGQEIRPGDRVVVTTGFEYEVGGPRTGYFKSERRDAKGPAWPETTSTRLIFNEADLPF